MEKVLFKVLILLTIIFFGGMSAAAIKFTKFLFQFQEIYY